MVPVRKARLRSRPRFDFYRCNRGTVGASVAGRRCTKTGGKIKEDAARLEKLKAHADEVLQELADGPDESRSGVRRRMENPRPPADAGGYRLAAVPVAALEPPLDRQAAADCLDLINGQLRGAGGGPIGAENVETGRRRTPSARVGSGQRRRMDRARQPAKVGGASGLGFTTRPVTALVPRWTTDNGSRAARLSFALLSAAAPVSLRREWP
jgi:hypothetical protein